MERQLESSLVYSVTIPAPQQGPEAIFSPALFPSSTGPTIFPPPNVQRNQMPSQNAVVVAVAGSSTAQAATLAVKNKTRNSTTILQTLICSRFIVRTRLELTLYFATVLVLCGARLY